MIDITVKMDEDLLLHKLKVVSNNIGILSWVSDVFSQQIGAKKVTTWLVSKKYFFIIYYTECISVTVISSNDEAQITIIGGGMEKGKNLEQDFLKKLKEENLIKL